MMPQDGEVKLSLGSEVSDCCWSDPRTAQIVLEINILKGNAAQVEIAFEINRHATWAL